MARQFDGVSDVATVTVDLSGQFRAMVAAWVYRDDSAANRQVFQYGAKSGFDVVANVGGGKDLIRSYGPALASWADTYPTPSLNVWHHYIWIFEAVTFNRVIIDGNDVGLTAAGHTPEPGYGWANNPLTIAGRAASNFLSCRVAEFALWNGEASTDPSGPPIDTERGLYWGWTPPGLFGGPNLYIPMLGDDPEPDYMGGRRSAVLTGTTAVRHPSTRTILMPGAA